MPTPQVPQGLQGPADDPVLQFDPALLLRAQGVRAAIFDVDGVLTDGGLLIGEQGEPLKRFNILDGQGLKLLQRAGITPVVVTGRDSAPLRQRLASLGITPARFGIDDKLPAAQELLEALGVPWNETAVIGDDWPDLPLMQRAHFAAAPPNAHAEVRARVAWITPSRGGEGAAREFCDLLLVASGRYAALLREVLA